MIYWAEWFRLLTHHARRVRTCARTHTHTHTHTHTGPSTPTRSRSPSGLLREHVTKPRRAGCRNSSSRSRCPPRPSGRPSGLQPGKTKRRLLMRQPHLSGPSAKEERRCQPLRGSRRATTTTTCSAQMVTMCIGHVYRHMNRHVCRPCV